MYVYESLEGWETHVAGRRLREQVPADIKAMPTDTTDEWIEQHLAEAKWRHELVSNDEDYIELSTISNYAGKYFCDASPGLCADRLEAIKSSGLNVPQYAIDELRDEEKSVRFKQ